MSDTAGAPITTAVRNQAPVTADARAPNPARTYAATPPATGWRTPRAANVRASGADSTSSPAQARIEAGPAVCTARAGTSSRPGPISAPTYSAAPRAMPMPANAIGQLG